MDSRLRGNDKKSEIASLTLAMTGGERVRLLRRPITGFSQ